MIAGLGGIALLGDRSRRSASSAWCVVAIGLIALAGRGAGAQVIVALGVAVTIGIYSVVDAKGIRSIDTPLYAAASFVCVTITTTVYALAPADRTRWSLRMRTYWRRFVMMGIASGITYALVQIAFQRAPVGYVTCLRESSVVIAAFVGARYLGEGQAIRRTVAAHRRGRRTAAAGDRPMTTAASRRSGDADEASGGDVAEPTECGGVHATSCTVARPDVSPMLLMTLKFGTSRLGARPCSCTRWPSSPMQADQRRRGESR